jgi:hypothetical protein
VEISHAQQVAFDAKHLKRWGSGEPFLPSITCHERDITEILDLIEARQAVR